MNEDRNKVYKLIQTIKRCKERVPRTDEGMRKRNQLKEVLKLLNYIFLNGIDKTIDFYEEQYNGGK